MIRRLQRRSRVYQGRLRRRLSGRRHADTVSLLAAAVLIGVTVGLAAAAFTQLVHLMASFVYETRETLGTTWGPLVVMFIPALGGLLITPIVVRWSPDVRGSGIPAVMLAVSNFGGRMARRIILWRPIATTLSIGSGASLGTEGPVVQLGGAIASLTSDLLKLNDEKRRSLVAVAAASGIAASFGAPIAGVLFALEVILGQFSNRYFATVVVGAVSASAVSRALLGADPAFAVPSYSPSTGLELPIYFGLGVLCGLLAVLFIQLIAGTENLFNRLPISPWLRPALGGLVVGVLGLLLPQLLGRGYSTTGAILVGDISAVGFLLVLALGKMLATSVSLAGWGSGGIFAPVLMIGAAIGAAFGRGAEMLLPGLGISPVAFALVGMGAIFSGSTRAPMSSIIMIFEISDDYTLILPLLLASVVATVVADLLHPESVYQLILSKRGLSLLRLRSDDLLQTVTVQEVMSPSVPSLKADATLEDFEAALHTSHHHGFLLLDPERPERFLGIVTLSDVEKATTQGAAPTTRLQEVGAQLVHVALPDEALSEVLERMAYYEIGRMPVVNPRDRQRAIGWLRQADVARAYARALTRERQQEERAGAQRLRELTGQEVLEVRVREGSRLRGKTLKEAALPKESIVVAIRRRGRTIFPHGDTTLEVNDIVVANVAPGFGPRFKRLFEREQA